MPIKTHIYRQKFVSILLVLDQKKMSLKSDQLEILLGVHAKAIKYVLNHRLSHSDHLDESILILSQEWFSYFISFFDEIYESKQNSPRWDVAFCFVMFILFAYIP